MADYPDPFAPPWQQPRLDTLLIQQDDSHRQRAMAKIPPPGAIPPGQLYVMIIRPPFEEMYELVMIDGQSDQLDAHEAYDWFRERGANMDSVELAMNHAWNFYSAEIVIENPKEPQSKRAAEPDI